ncbi:unnamed protein product [Symbiodinium sp. CCMP2456]|nr:unnamed protein product [Symbiodinium sp. CCMP2456]
MSKAAQLAALNAAATAGDVAAARRCFDSLQPRDRARTVAWNTMLKAHAVAGDLNGATEHFREMLGQRVCINGRTFGKLIRAAAEAAEPEQGAWFLQQQCASGLEVDMVTYTTIADAFSKAGRPDEAEAFLLRANARGLALDSVAMGALSAGFAKLGQAEKAQHWLEEMVRQGLEPSPESIGAVAAAWAQRGKPLQAEMWLREMRERQLEPSPSMITSLVHGCSKSGQPKAGAAFVEQLQKEGTTPTVEVYNAMLSGCARLGKTTQAEAKFREMLDASLQPDVITFNSMIDAYAKHGDLAAAERLLQQMNAAGISPDTITFTSLIKCCAKLGDVSGASKWLSEMQRRGLDADVVTYTAIIHACAKKGKVEEATQWMEHMQSSGLQADCVAWAALINAYAKRSDADGALALLRELAAQASEPNVVAYSAVLKAFARTAQADRVGSLLQEMQGLAVTPNLITWTSAIEACAKSQPRRREEAEDLLRQAIRSGLKPDAKLIRTMMRAVGAPRCMSLCRELGAPRLTAAPCAPHAVAFQLCAFVCQFVILRCLLEATEAAMDVFASRSKLNKLCWENVRLTTDGLVRVEVQSADRLQQIVTLLIRKVLAEPYFSDLYAELVSGLWNKYQVFPAEGDMKPHSFARIFLNTVQAEFEDLLAKLESGQTGRSTHTAELKLGVETKRTSEMLRALMMFMGHLFLKQLLALRVLDHVVEELIGLDDAARPWPEEYRIECVCELFRIVGCKLDETARGMEMFSTLARRLREINTKYQSLAKPVCSKRIDFIIDSLLRMRENS